MSERIFDKIRRKYVALTPEEEVRQRIVDILNKDFAYPLTRFSIEAAINVGKRQRRYDLLVRDKDGNPFMLVECKARNVTINDKVFYQVTAYNMEIHAPYILISNCDCTLIFENTPEGYKQIDKIPELP